MQKSTHEGACMRVSRIACLHAKAGASAAMRDKLPKTGTHVRAHNTMRANETKRGISTKHAANTRASTHHTGNKEAYMKQCTHAHT